jgi:hypothetical protein
MKKPKPSRGINVSAFNTLQPVTGAEQRSQQPSPILYSAEMRRQIMHEMGRRGGEKGAKARAAALSMKERCEMAKKAASAWWKAKEAP